MGAGEDNPGRGIRAIVPTQDGFGDGDFPRRSGVQHLCGAPRRTKDPRLAIRKGLSWFARDQKLFQFRGGRLLSSAFPDCTPPFAAALAELVKTGGESEADFALSVVCVRGDRAPQPAPDPLRRYRPSEFRLDAPPRGESYAVHANPIRGGLHHEYFLAPAGA